MNFKRGKSKGYTSKQDLTLRVEVLEEIKEINENDENIVTELWKEMKVLWNENEQARKDLACMDLDMGPALNGFQIGVGKDNFEIEFDENMIDKERRANKKGAPLKKVRSFLTGDKDKTNNMKEKGNNASKNSKTKEGQIKKKNRRKQRLIDTTLMQTQNTSFTPRHQDIEDCESSSVSSYKTLTQSRSRNQYLIEHIEFNKQRRSRSNRPNNWNLREQFIPESLTVSFDSGRGR